MDFNVSIQKKHLFVTLLGLFVLSGLVIGVAFGGSDPAVHGHNFGEVEVIESDPTVLSSVKDGVSWTEVSGRPAGLDDGDQIGLTNINSELIFGSGSSMSLPSGSNYDVLIWGYYFDCVDLATNLRLDGNNVKTYTGDDKDSHGCDQNTISTKIGSVSSGSHTWSLSRGSQHNFVWMAKRK